VEVGTPLENVYVTFRGTPLETVAVQTFDPPLDLTNCGEVLMSLTSGELEVLLASMQLVGERDVEDGGSALMGMKAAKKETLEFELPDTGGPLLVRAIRVLFQRPADPTRSTKVAVEGLIPVSRVR
jgi:hypothetical protein